MRPPIQKRGHSRSISHGGIINPDSAFFNPCLAITSESYPNYNEGKIIKGVNEW